MKLSDYGFGDLASQQFMNSLKQTTHDNYRQGWFKFLEFTGLTSDRILQSRRAQTKLPEDDPERFHWEHKVMEFKKWITKQPSPEKKRSYASSTARAYTIAVRSFFAYNRAYVGVKNEDPDMANNLLTFGVVWTFVLAILGWIMFLH